MCAPFTTAHDCQIKSNRNFSLNINTGTRTAENKNEGGLSTYRSWLNKGTALIVQRCGSKPYCEFFHLRSQIGFDSAALGHIFPLPWPTLLCFYWANIRHRSSPVNACTWAVGHIQQTQCRSNIAISSSLVHYILIPYRSRMM